MAVKTDCMYEISYCCWSTWTDGLTGVVYRLVEVLLLMAQQLGCYKVTLECKVENIKFYEPLGFVVDEQRYMVQRLKQ